MMNKLDVVAKVFSIIGNIAKVLELILKLI